MKKLIFFLFLFSIEVAFGEEFFLGVIRRRKRMMKPSLRVNDVESNVWISASVVDSFNNVFVCGSGQNDLGVLKMFNVQGELLWQKTFSDLVAPCYGMALDPNQNVYVASCKVVNGNCQVNYMSFDQNGILLQDVVAVMDGGDGDHSSDIIIDYPNIYIAGWTQSSNYFGLPSIGIADGFLSKFNAVTGAHISSIRFGSQTWDPNAEEEDDDLLVSGVTVPNALIIDSDKNIYVTGTAFGNFMGENSIGKKDIFLVKINSLSNSIIYSKLFGSAQNDFAQDIAISSSGDFVYVVGSSSGSFSDFGSHGVNSGQRDVLFSKIHAANGSVVFHHLFGTSSVDGGSALIANPQDSKRFFITGVTGGDLNGVPSLGNDDAFVVEVNDVGDIQQTTLLGSAGYDYGVTLAVQYKEALPYLLLGGYNNSHLVSENGDTWLGGGQMLMTSIAFGSEPGQETCSDKLSSIRENMGKYAKKHALKRSSSRSFTFIGNAIESVTGEKARPFPRSKGKCRATSSPGNQRSTLIRLGFQEIPKATKNGDIAVFSCVKGHVNGHIQMLYQKKWYSDYAQKTWAPWKDLSGSKVKYYRYMKCDE